MLVRETQANQPGASIRDPPCAHAHVHLLLLSIACSAAPSGAAYLSPIRDVAVRYVGSFHMRTVAVGAVRGDGARQEVKNCRNRGCRNARMVRVAPRPADTAPRQHGRQGRGVPRLGACISKWSRRRHEVAGARAAQDAYPRVRGRELLVNRIHERYGVHARGEGGWVAAGPCAGGSKLALGHSTTMPHPRRRACSR